MSDKVLEMLEELKDDIAHLSTWESNFINDLITRTGRGHKLTAKQNLKVSEIWSAWWPVHSRRET